MVAERKNNGKRTTQKGKRAPAKQKKNSLPMAFVFWLGFFIIVTGLFVINRETIRKNFAIFTQRLNISSNIVPPEDKPSEPDTPPSTGPGTALPPAPPAPEKPAVQPATPIKPAAQPEKPEAAPRPATDKPATTTAPATQPAAKPEPATQPARPAETRDRNIYFTQVDKDGTILRTRVSRKIPPSDSPMQDSLNALLSGPTAEEQTRGLLSLIPRNTKILSAVVRGNTAYISFSEDFQYNTYGVEGYAAQLRQIVWTATEFPNIKDVQILIEGRRIDYLGEGIWIGSPVSRESL